MRSSSNVYRYGLVIAACSIALFVGWSSGAEATCLLLAVMVSSLYGGRYPSLFGTAFDGTIAVPHSSAPHLRCVRHTTHSKEIP